MKKSKKLISYAQSDAQRSSLGVVKKASSQLKKKNWKKIPFSYM